MTSQSGEIPQEEIERIEREATDLHQIAFFHRVVKNYLKMKRILFSDGVSVEFVPRYKVVVNKHTFTGYDYEVKELAILFGVTGVSPA